MDDSDKKDQNAFDRYLEDTVFSDSNAHKNTDGQVDNPEVSIETPPKKFAADHSANPEEESKTVTGFGQLLRTERLKRGLSVGEVSRRLRLSVQQINAIEEEDYSKLPTGTFLRGFVRNYGSLLQLDTDLLLQSLAHSAPVSAYPSHAKQIKTIPLVSSKKRGGGWRAIWFSAVILILAMLGYGLYQDRDWNQESMLKNEADVGVLFDSHVESGQATMELLLPQIPSTPAPPTSASKPLERSSSEIGLVPSIPTVVEPVVTEAIETSEKTLHFIFSKESWVEIRDEDRKVIFVKTNPKGSEQVIQGTPPFYLVIGNASGVNLTYNGKLVDLTPYTRKNDDVARFSLE